MVEETTPRTVADPEPPAWVRILHSYRSSDSRKAYLETLKQLREPLKKDAPTDKSFELVQAAFREGAPSEQSVQPVLKAWWIVQQFRQKSTGKEEERVFWPLLERPVRVVWRGLLEGGGEFVQKNWAENVIGPTKGTSEIERLNALYGAQGKVREFVDKFMKPFLVENESRLGRVLDAELPISQQRFLKILHDEKQLRPLLEDVGKAPVIVVASKDTGFNSSTNLVDEKTEFLLNCKDKPVKITNKAKEANGTSATIYWSPDGCSEVVITILASCNVRCVENASKVGITVDDTAPWPLTKSYAGQSGFLNFMKDFRNNNAHEFRKPDFLESLTPAERQQLERAWDRHEIKTITVYYRLHVPPSLDKLLVLSPTVIVPQTLLK
jgi:hypothetical protein